jgi:hypothetical protein
MILYDIITYKDQIFRGSGGRNPSWVDIGRLLGGIIENERL